MKNSNKVTLKGRITRLGFGNHTTKGIIEIERNSGGVDQVPFIIKTKMNIYAEWVTIKGRLCTSNVKGDDGKTHKKIYVQAEKILLNEDQEQLNEVEFDGTLVYKDKLRATPKGKIIMDIVVAINDEFGSQYPSLIVWGVTAERLSIMPIGTKMSVKGKFQSRPYVKRTEDKEEVKIAYEINVRNAEVL